MIRRTLSILLLLTLLPLVPAGAEGGETAGFTVQGITLERDGKALYGELYLPEKEGPLPLVILCHGFGGNRTHMAVYARLFARNGIAAFAFDFIGGGLVSRSDGTMKEMSVLTEAADLDVVMDRMMELPEIDGNHIFLMGASQGGFVCSYTAGKRPGDVAGLIALFPAYVLQDNAWAQTPDPDNIPETISLMGLTLGRIYNADAMSFDIYEVIANYPGKVLILHGTKDFVVPISYSERAAEIFPDAELVRYEGAGHGFQGRDETDAEERSLAFVQQILGAKEAE